MGAHQPSSFHGKVREAVQLLGECTNSQVMEKVEKLISAPIACRAARQELQQKERTRFSDKRVKTHYTTSQLLTMGKRRITNNSLSRLARRGDIVRVRKGVYKPVGLRLYQAS